MLEPVHVLRNGTVDDVRQRTTEILRIMAPQGGFIIGPGCAAAGYAGREHPRADRLARTVGRYASDGSLKAAGVPGV